MPANVPHSSPLGIGQAEAIQVLRHKVGRGHVPDSERLREQILKAVDHALAMHAVKTGRPDPTEQRAFYHGLMTGYSVAMCLVTQQEMAGRS